jgi:hypothetical protein
MIISPGNCRVVDSDFSKLTGAGRGRRGGVGLAGLTMLLVLEFSLWVLKILKKERRETQIRRSETEIPNTQKHWTQRGGDP